MPKRDSAKIRREPNESYEYHAPPQRGARTFLAFFFIALAFAGAELVAAFQPHVAADVEARTVKVRSDVLASPDLQTIEAGGAGLAVIVGALLVFLAGKRGVGFMLPTLILMVPAAYAGIVPKGHKRDLLDEREKLLASTASVTSERDEAKTRVEEAQKAADERAAKITALEAKSAQDVADMKKQLDDSAAKEKDLEKKVEEANTAAQKAASDRDQALMEKNAQIEEMGKSAKAAEEEKAKEDALVKDLRAQIDELKKSKPADSKPAPEKPADQKPADQKPADPPK